jgi:hypothetical protein
MTDLDVNRQVRKVLVRHWIDLGRLSLRSLKGKVWIRGCLQRIEGVEEALTAAIVSTMFEEVQKSRGVRALNIELENWINTTGMWHPTDKSASRRTARPGGTGPQAGAFKMDDK